MEQKAKSEKQKANKFQAGREKEQSFKLSPLSFRLINGGLAQLARASALHAEGQRFESVILTLSRKVKAKSTKPLKAFSFRL